MDQTGSPIIEIDFQRKQNQERLACVRFYDDEQGTVRWLAERYALLYKEYGKVLARPSRGRVSEERLAKTDSLYRATETLADATKALACRRLGFVLGRGDPVFVAEPMRAVYIETDPGERSALKIYAAELEPNYVKSIEAGDITDWGLGLLNDNTITFI